MPARLLLIPLGTRGGNSHLCFYNPIAALLYFSTHILNICLRLTSHVGSSLSILFIVYFMDLAQLQAHCIYLLNKYLLKK